MSQPHFLLRGETRGEVFAIHFEGGELPLDEAHTAAVANDLWSLARESDRLECLVDLRNVVALSTPALLVLVKLRRQLQAAGKRLALCNLRPGVVELLEVSRLNRLFIIRQDDAAGLSPPVTDSAALEVDLRSKQGQSSSEPGPLAILTR